MFLSHQLEDSTAATKAFSFLFSHNQVSCDNNTSLQLLEIISTLVSGWYTMLFLWGKLVYIGNKIQKCWYIQIYLQLLVSLIMAFLSFFLLLIEVLVNHINFLYIAFSSEELLVSSHCTNQCWRSPFTSYGMQPFSTASFLFSLPSAKCSYEI